MPTLQDSLASDSEGQTYSTQNGTFQKVGNWVNFRAYITMTSLGSLTGSLYLAGLDLSSESVTNTHSPIYCGFAAGLNITAGNSVTGYMDPGANRVILKKWSLSGGISSLTTSDVTSSMAIIIAGRYKV